MEAAEAEARAKGRKYVSSVLQRPEQLEKVAQYRRRVARKKASVDAAVKTALQSQLDGVRNGLELVQSALSDVIDVRKGLEGFDANLNNLPELDALKEEHLRHSQFVTAMDNLKHIFTVPDSVNKTKAWISEDKLLFARQSLADLETSRDDLMFELYKLNSGSNGDMVLLKMYFGEVAELSNLMEKQLRLILSRTLNTVRKDSAKIVTALRVVEGEELADAAALQRKQHYGFETPGRPKQWKKLALDVLRGAVASRIEGTQTEEREGDKMWLVRHLELTRQLVAEDLLVVRTLCVPVFPPSWNIVRCYTEMYQSCLQAHIEDIIGRGLEGNEIVTLLSWALVSYPELGFVGPLLSGPMVTQLQDQYLSDIKNKLTEWISRTIEKEKEDWFRGIAPEQDGEVFLSAAPSIISEMVEQNFSVARTVSPELTVRVQQLSVEQVIRYAQLYAKAVQELRARHFADRNRNAFYTQHMIAVLNNCMTLTLNCTEWTRDDRLRKAVLATRDEAILYLLQEAFTDLKPQFDLLFSQPWLDSRVPVDTICLTFEDYFQDYKHLLPINLDAVLLVAQEKVARAYIYKIIQGNISFVNYDERRKATGKIRAEISQVTALFSKLAPKLPTDPAFNLIDPIVEIISSEDQDMLLLDLHRLVEQFPDVTDEQLTSLLLTRGDLTRTEVRDKVTTALAARIEIKETFLRKGMFTLMGKGALNLDWDHYWSSHILSWNIDTSN